MTYERRPSEYPPTIRKLFGRPALVEGEDRALYDELLSLIVAEVEPSLLAEWLLVKDVADAEWEQMRLSGFKANMINRRAKPILASALAALAKQKAAAPKPRTGSKAAADEVNELLEQYQERAHRQTTVAFEETINEQLNADRMVSAALTRRRFAYGELERLRAIKLKHLPRSPSVQPGNGPSGEDAPAPERVGGFPDTGGAAERGA